MALTPARGFITPSVLHSVVSVVRAGVAARPWSAGRAISAAHEVNCGEIMGESGVLPAVCLARSPGHCDDHRVQLTVGGKAAPWSGPGFGPSALEGRRISFDGSPWSKELYR